jgi:hypothetical protein
MFSRILIPMTTPLAISPSSSTNPPDLTFNFPITWKVTPLKIRIFGETNLFYWNNLMHDLSYQYGFDESLR